jgi:cytoskeletal protein CcmA (bactofilin family)
MLGTKDKGSFGGSGSTTLISRDTEIVGDIKFSGNLDIEGTVRGNIAAHASKDAVVRIVDKGLVEGEIRAPSVIINGHVVGDVYSSKHLELAAKARVQGNVHYTLVEMAIGAEVNGGLKHSVGAADGTEPAAKSKSKSARNATEPGMRDTSAAMKT